MNTKKLFLLLAAVLLGSASAFAQSGNNEPLKGDVNGDGKVDVGDITAIIKIIKDGGGTATENTWFFGTLTEAQLMDQSYVNSLVYNQSGNKPSTLTVPNRYPTPEGNYLVFIYPSSWGTATIKSVNGFGTGDADASDAGITNPSNKVLKWWMGNGLTAGTVFNITWSETFYWYVGTTKPTSLSQAIAVDSYPSEYTYTNNSGAKAHIFVLTNSDKIVTFINPQLNTPVDQVAVDEITIPGYKIFETAVGTANGGSIIIRISPETAWYYYAGWTLPTASNVDEIINETYPSESGSTTMNKAGKKTSSKSEMNYCTNTLYYSVAKTNYYVLVPTGHAVYDSLGNNVLSSTFTTQGDITVGNQIHTIYKSNATSRNINAIIIE